MTESQFINQVGLWEMDPKTGMTITKGLSRRIWVVNSSAGETAFTGPFDDAYKYYTTFVTCFRGSEEFKPQQIGKAVYENH